MENRLSENKSIFRVNFIISPARAFRKENIRKLPKKSEKAKHPRPTGDSRTKKKFPVQHPPIYAIIIPQTQKEARPEDG
jgi:hypothetical protein